jgi:hypothetical protein
VAEALVEADEPGLCPRAEHILELVSRLATNYSAAERKEIANLLPRVRKRTGL